jgi:chemotaxis protein MotB
MAIRAHVRSQPIVVRENSVWNLSTSRASKIREILEEQGYDPLKIVQTAGEADRDPAIGDLTNVRNNRIEIVFLRTDA